MAKYVVEYPSEIKRTKYVTTEKGVLKETEGRVQHLGASRYYYKPSMRRVIIRKTGVKSVSEKVREVNKYLAKLKNSVNAPAVQCAGKDWGDFVSCLSTQMKDNVLKDYTHKTAQPIKAAEFEEKH